MLKNCKNWLKASALALLLGVSPQMMAQKVFFPQEEKPGVAQLSQKGEVYTISNNLLSASFKKIGGKLTFEGCQAMDLLPNDELFKIQVDNGTDVYASQMKLGEVTVKDLIPNPNAKPAPAKGSLLVKGKAIEAKYSYKGLDLIWRAVLRDGSHYLRTEMEVAAKTTTKMHSIIPMMYTVDNSKNEKAPAIVGNTRGAILVSDKIFAGLETPMGINVVKSAGSEEFNSFDPTAWNPRSFRWRPETELPSEITAEKVVAMRGYMKFYTAGDNTITLTKTSGDNMKFVGIDVVDLAGKVVAKDYREIEAGTAAYTVKIPSVDNYLVRYYVSAPQGVNSKGTIAYDHQVLKASVVFDGGKQTEKKAAFVGTRALSGKVLGENGTLNDSWTKDSWKALDGVMPWRIGELGFSKEQVRVIEQELEITSEGKLTVEFLYTPNSGPNRLNLAGVGLYDAHGNEAAYDFHIGFTGGEKKDNVYTLFVPYTGKFKLRYYAETKTEPINSKGSINIKLVYENIVHLPAPKSSEIEGKWSRNVNLEAGKTWNVSAVVGLVAKDQARRSILAYVERERAVPWRPMPIYNSWYELNINRNNDINYTGNMKDWQCVDIVKQWKKNLYDQYGTGIECFVWDDGWDIYGTWEFNKNFPRGFEVPDSLCRAMGTGTGVWLGPVGGYGKSGDYRRDYWMNKGEMILSNKAYYDVFYKGCTNLMNAYDFRFFKFDGISKQFTSVGPDGGTVGEENAEAIIYAEMDMRKVQPDIFFNTSVGTWASPFWFQITDAVWRQENDFGKTGVNPSDREQWITYRDRLVYQNFVKNSPMCPINNLMTHGFILSKFGNVSSDIRYDAVVREMRCAFACGSSMVELYCDYSLMNDIPNAAGQKGLLWGELAECIEWQKKNADVLPDIHWVGGNPWTGSKEEVYGWAAWNGEGAVLTFRNGANQEQTFTTTLRKALDIPAYQKGSITLTKAFADQAELKGLPSGQPVDMDQTITVTLPASSVYVFDNTGAVVLPAVVVNSLDQINSHSAYTLQTIGKKFLTVENGALKSAANAGEKFAFLSNKYVPNGQYYMYAIGAQKFVSVKNGKFVFSVEPEAAVELAQVAEKNNKYFVVKAEDKLLTLAAADASLVAGQAGNDNSFLLTAVNTKEELSVPYVKLMDFFIHNKISRKGWKIEASSWCYDDDAKVNGPAQCMIDDNPSTFWHSNWRGDSGTGAGNMPYVITVDLGEVQNINSFGVLPRQAKNNGRIKNYIFSVSQNKEDWTAVQSGTVYFKDAQDEGVKWVDFNQTYSAKYVRLTITSNQAGDNLGNMAEFYLAADGSAATASLKNLPEFSTEELAEWYKFQFNNGSAYLEDKGADARLKTANANNIDAQKWQFIGNANNFIMRSKAGRYVTFKEGHFCAVAEKANASVLEFVQHGKNKELLELKVKGHGQCMNQEYGGGAGRDLAEYNQNDGGNAFSLKSLKLPQPKAPLFSEGQDENWYLIQFKRGGFALTDMGTDKAVRTDKLAPSKSKLWKLVGTPEKFQLINKLGHYMTVKAATSEANHEHLGVATTAYAPGFKMINSTNEEFSPAWEIQPNGKNPFNQYGGFGIGKAIGFWNAGDPNNPLQFLDPEKVDYSEFEVEGTTTFKPEHNLTLWYRQPAADWMEYSLPIGNGQLGASIFGGVYRDEVQFNEKTLWSGTSRDNGQEYGDYENFGSVIAENLNGDKFTFSEENPVKNYVRGLDLKNAKAFVNFENKEGVKYNREYIASYPDKVVAVRYAASEKGKVSLRFTFKNGVLEEGKQGIVKNNPTYADNCGEFSGKMQTISYKAKFKVVPTGGEISTDAKGVTVRNADEVLLILTGATDFDAYNKTYVSNTAQLASTVDARVNDAAGKGWNDLQKAQVADFKSYFDRCDFNLDGSANTMATDELIRQYEKKVTGKEDYALMLEQIYFAYGRYLELGSSRGVDLPSNLQGIWNNNSETAWNGDIHANINVQMNYWPAEPTNLSDMHKPFLNYIINMANSDQWKKYAKDAGQEEGWTCYTENNIFGGVGNFMHEYVTANAWYCTHLWQHYRYTLDKEFLKKAFPAMWTASRFWITRLKKAADGSYECPDEYSPEHGPHQDGVAHAQQLVWDLLANTLKAAEILGNDVPKEVTPALLAIHKERLEKLDKGLATETYKPTGKNGWVDNNNGIKKGDVLLREWKYSDFTAGANGHRHMSHLMCVYPFNQVTPGSEYFDAAVNSMKLRGDASTGWSMGWKINLWARVLDGNHAHNILKLALRHHSISGGGVYYNLYDSHAPFQIDGNFGACAGIAEMLMQSQNDTIQLLPALPSVWKKGDIKGLKAIGDFTVDVAWDNLKATSAKIVSNQGQPLFINYKDIATKKILVNNAEVVAKKINANTIMVDAKANDVVTIDFAQTATGIDGVAADAQDGEKVIYNLQGIRMNIEYSQLPKGVYIVNGEKVMVK